MRWLVPGSRGFLLALLLRYTFGGGVRDIGRLCIVLQDLLADKLETTETHRWGIRC